MAMKLRYVVLGVLTILGHGIRQVWLGKDR